ncbi:phage tail protein [Vibrio cholerae]|uniref:Phage tail fibre protein N-terminal domain-containing protein n=1 Tax=Vibrio cholerae TaxID=666 RepID=A0A7Z7YC39_VIBCL|nr:phage tail protein [Vibrio cholerae]TBM39805.1 hypothetical protein EYB64_16335 [Vibrio cholerae]
MSAKYYTILTEVGKTKVANAAALGRQIKLKQLAVGDGNGSEYDPVEKQESLKRETYRTPISHLGTDAQNKNWVIAEGMIPVDVGGWFVREVGLFDEDGDLFAVGKYPETYKPTLSEGTGRDLYIRFVMVVSNTESIDLKIDPTVAIATRKYVDEATKNLVDKEFLSEQIKDLATVAYVDEAMKSVSSVVVEATSQAEEDAAFAAGALAVIRLDLLAPRSSLFVDFDNPSIFEDLSEFSHELVSTGSPSTIVDSASPMLGRVGDFTNGGYLTSADHPSFRLSGKSWGIEAYVKLKTTNVSNFIVSKGQPGALNESWYLALLWDGTKLNMAFVGKNNKPIFHVEYPFGHDTEKYHHISVNCDGSTVKVYLDGELNTYSVVPSIHDGIGDLNIGRWNYGSANTAGCYIDNLIITNDGPLRTGNFTPPSA